MSRKTWVIFFILIIVGLCFLVSGTPAAANGGPHEGDFTTTTYACAGCHRTHTGAAAEKLLKGGTQVALCDICHDGNGADTNVVDGLYLGDTQGTQNGGLRGGGFTNAYMDTDVDGSISPTAVSSRHTAGSANPVAWGSGALGDNDAGEVISSLECSNCHNPHGNSSYRILRPIPSGLVDDAASANITINASLETGKNYTIGYDSSNYRDMGEYPSGVLALMTEWCGQCHGRYEAGTGSGENDSGDTIFKYRHMTEGLGGECLKCHVAHGTSATMSHYAAAPDINWPDGTDPSGWQGSENDYSRLLNIDNRGVCVYCHITDTGEVSGHGGDSDCSGCHGSSGSHTVHVTANAIGPATPLECVDCHDANNYPNFSDGQSLDSTTVCDTCHSPGGSYNGVDSTGSSVGAKDNWDTGVYTANTLNEGKEKWCAGCHDESPSVISTVTAPNVIGDEDGTYIYGTGWGFYKTGHGLSGSTSYPTSGGVVSGAGIECNQCHNNAETHIDGVSRTFDDMDSSTTDPGVYREGYRLKLVNEQEPMLIPWPQNTSPVNSADYYRLCTDSGCHGSGPFVSSSNMETNLVTDGVNRHEYHLVQNQLRYASDWSGALNSRMTCVNCHNVHGSKSLAMVLDGELTSNEPGLRIWYYNPDIVSYSASSPNPPSPENLPLSASTGTVWSAGSSSNLCTHCHGNVNLAAESRVPYQDVDVVPVLNWTGEANYISDGIHPDSGHGGTSFEFRIDYSDNNNDGPTIIQVLIDKNDDGDFLDSGEAVDMTEVNVTDIIYTDGKIYNATVTLDKAGDNNLNYKFAASDNFGYAINNAPVSGGTVTLTNATPVLSWTGQAGYESDGVVPNSASSNSTFEFRVKYTDADNEAPSSIQVQIDKNDDADYLDAGETVNMVPYDGDTDYTDGKIYTYTTDLAYTGDGLLNYTFAASDGIESATGTPTGTNTVTVTETSNSAPVLSWTGEDYYTSDGINPEFDAGGRPFTFRISYSDGNNEAPNVIQVWVDRNDDGDYLDTDEQITMEEDNAGDNDYSDGKVYRKILYLEHPGTANKIENLNYRFYAEDAQGAEATGGDPVSNSILSVQDAIKVPSEVGTMTAAIAAAVDGDIILVADGSYNEYVDFNGKDNIIIKATYEPDSDNATIITNHFHLGSQYGGADNVTISGFKVSSASAQAFYLQESLATVDNCLFDTNSGNAVYVSGFAKVTVQNSTFQNNTDTALYLNQSGGYVDVFDCTFINNSKAGGNGGAIYGNSNGNWNIQRTTFTENTAANGGVLLAYSAKMTINECTINENTATNGGGAFYFSTTSSNVTITNSYLKGNTAGGGGGGAVYIENGAYVSMTNVVLTGNKATGNGGAINDRGYSDYLFCTFSGNSGTNGGAIYHLNAYTTTLKNCIVYNNDSTTVGSYDQIHTNYRWNYVDVYNTLINQTPGSGSGDARNSYEDMGGNIIDQDPLFVDGLSPASAATVAGDYRLESESPCINTGNSSYPYDRDVIGISRPLGGGYDMGAYEKE